MVPVWDSRSEGSQWHRDRKRRGVSLDVCSTMNEKMIVLLALQLPSPSFQFRRKGCGEIFMPCEAQS